MTAVHADPAVPPSDEACDFEGALSSMGDDPELFQDVASVLAVEAPRQLARLAAALAAGDAATARREAHTLKGTYGTVRALGAQGLAARLEAALASGRADPAETRALYARLEAAGAAAVAALREFRPAPISAAS